MGTDIHGVFQKKTPEGWEDIPSEYSEDRHYLLFAWLGNVRNGFGFAGLKTFVQIPSLSDHRGIPDDFVMNSDSHPVKDLNIWMGDHSYSWVTGEEILSASLGTVKRYGVISKEEYEKWDKISQPQSWCGGITGRDVVVSRPEEITDNTTHVEIEWDRDLKEDIEYFIKEVERLTKKHGEIRFVFGFDS